MAIKKAPPKPAAAAAAPAPKATPKPAAAAAPAPKAATVEAVVDTAQPTATIALGAKVKKNLGNYESAEISAFYSQQCSPDDYEETKAVVLDRVRELLEEAATGIDLGQYAGGAAEGTDPEGEVDGDAEGTPDAGVEGEEEGDLDADAVRAMDRDDLVSLIEGNQLEIDPDEYPEDDDLREAVVAIAFGEEGADEPYTQETLEGATTEDLKAIYEAWELGEFPKGNEKIARNKAIKKILETQNAAAA